MFNPPNGYHSVLAGNIQPLFDEFSWQSFVTFNWPSDTQGNPVGSFFSGADCTRVWETYTDPGQVFYSFQNDVSLGAAAAEARKQGKKFFYMDSKLSPELLNGADNVQFDGFAVIDRNLNFTLYEEKMNPDEVAFVDANNLHTRANIIAYGKQHDNAISLPAGYYDNPAKASGGKVGMVEFKATWRILDPSKGDDPSRFYHKPATIYVAAKNSASKKSFTISAEVGLVAIHIIHKTNKFSFQVWTTFVHDDNNPDSTQYANKNFGNTHYSYFNQACSDCPINTPVKPGPDGYIWNTTAPWCSRCIRPARVLPVC
jgi:hypothetical protein